MGIELINCEISIGYIGTRNEILIQMALEAANRFMEWLREFANRVSYAISKACERFVECMNLQSGRISAKPVRWPSPAIAGK